MSKIKYIYEYHLSGDLYWTDEKQPYEKLRCNICGDSDWLACEARCKEDIIKHFIGDDPDDCGYDIDYINEFANSIIWEDDV